MVTAMEQPAAAPEPPAQRQGHCSRCDKVWTLPEAQGVCQWCGKQATCQQSRSSRSITNRRRLKRPERPVIGKDYDQLPEPYLTFYNVAVPFAKSVPAQDGEDLLHTIIANLIDADRSNGHKPDNHSWMYRIASFTKAQYWREHYKLTNGLTCCSCSKTQRAKCRENNLYLECPKAIKLESLNKPIIDSEGNLTELGELIADNKAIDLDAWVSDSTWEIGYPKRLVAIAYNLKAGIPLAKAEHSYLERFRKREQKRLF